MSKIKDVILDVEREIESEWLSFSQIARKYNVSVEFVQMVYKQMQERWDLN